MATSPKPRSKAEAKGKPKTTIGRKAARRPRRRAEAPSRRAAQVFLSYRRNDSIEQTNRLYDVLVREFPADGVFIDRAAIAGGENFQTAMLAEVRRSRVVLVVIGPDWAGAPAAAGAPDAPPSRLHEPDDAVRQEVEAALAGLAEGRHVLPLLVGGARMPGPAQLPPELAGLSRINALQMRSGDDQRGDLDRILARLHQLLPAGGPPQPFLPHSYDGEDESFRRLESIFDSIHQNLQALLATCSSHASALRHQAESALALARHQGAPHPALALSLLAHDRGARLSHLNAAIDSELYATHAVGNLSGAGDMTKWRGEAREELDAALRLGAPFHAVWRALRPIAAVGWVYYTSSRRFIHIVPWIHSREFAYADRLLQMDFFRLGRPRADPGRQVFWTTPYLDHFGKGMMVTVGAPVYHGRRFCGTVAIDLGIDLLNDFVRTQPLNHGVVFIVDAEGKLVAAPNFTSSRDTGGRHASEVLPGTLATRDPASLFDRDGAWVAGQHVMLVRKLEGTPWKLVHVRARSELP